MEERDTTLTRLLWILGQAALIVGIVFVLLAGRQRDWRVPLHFSADSLEYLMQVKGTIDQGWWWFHPRLSAPSTFAQLAYPSNTSVDQALVWAVRAFTRDAGLCLNVTWMLMLALCGVIATWTFRRVGLSRATATTAGTLYALSPYALYRNIEHFSLVMYLVPIPCAAALLVATRRLPPLRSRAAALLAAGCVLLGLNYTYYAFFGAFVLLVASVIALAQGRAHPAWRRGMTLVAVVAVATAINLAPSWVVWSREGRPLIIPEKTAAESEFYGLKIRDFISPVLDQTLAPLKAWNDLEARARYPLETENATSRLGLLGTLGFLGLVLVLIVPGLAGRFADPPLAAAAAALTLALVLLGTVGGFGSVFSLLISPEIRSYNRVYPFIAFFSWLAVGMAADGLVRGPGDSGGPLAAGRGLRLAVLAGALVIGMYDQGRAAQPLNRAYAAIRDERSSLAAFVQALEHEMPPGAMVFQLPVTTYLNDHGEERMRPYDEIKPYLVSSSVHWSYPALDNAVVRWQHAVGRLPAPALAAALDAAGFSAVVIDRDGYADGGASLLRQLMANASRAVIAESARYIAIDLTRAAVSDASGPRLPAWPDTFGPATSGLPACGPPAEANLDSVGPIKIAPSRPVPVPRWGDVTLRGWAVDAARHDLAGDVDVVVDDLVVATFYGVDRPDIASRYATPAYRYAGFLTTVPASRLASGTHAIRVRVLSADRRCFSDTAAVTIVVP